MATRRKAFTLIELLIVVAIIAILAAIAVPNLLEAQVWAKVSRVRNDLRAIATGMETYFIDWNDYPETNDEALISPGFRAAARGLLRLTTPVPYLALVPFDPFLNETEGSAMTGNLTYEVASTGLTGKQPKGWAAYSCGPDRTDDIGPGAPEYPAVQLDTTVYDPSNGTISKGDILRFGPSFGCSFR